MTATALRSLRAAAEAGAPARGRGAERPPGEPRRVGYLYLLPAFAIYAAFVLAPLAHAIWLSLLLTGTA